MIDTYKAHLQEENAKIDISEQDQNDLQASDIAIRKFNINMGMKSRNPLQTVSFYREVNGVYQHVQKDPDEISMMMAENCQRTIVRCFLKDEQKFE